MSSKFSGGSQAASRQRTPAKAMLARGTENARCPYLDYSPYCNEFFDPLRVDTKTLYPAARGTLRNQQIRQSCQNHGCTLFIPFIHPRLLLTLDFSIFTILYTQSFFL